MPSKYPIVSPKEVIKALSFKGFIEVSQKGSHKKFSDGVHWLLFRCMTSLPEVL